MTKLFFDIETLPAPEELHEILKEIYQKKIEDDKKRPETVEEFIEQTNFDGAFGRIAEICKYCEADVEVTRKIYNKMTFLESLTKEIF